MNIYWSIYRTLYGLTCVGLVLVFSGCSSTTPAVHPAATSQVSEHAVTASPASAAEMALRTDVPMALIPAGEFPMGSVKGSTHAKMSEGPQRMVFLDAYYVDVYEVTTKDYAKFLLATQPQAPKAWNQVDFAKHGDRPVVGVTWDDAVAYCTWVGKRLPTEAEWEKAARGTDGRQYPWGNEAPTSDRATLTKKWDGYDTPTPVGSLEAGKSPYGIYDMAGNAMEWVSDWYDQNYYDTAPSKNPTGPETGKAGVVRGGGWGFLPKDVRAANRINPPHETRCTNIGFRCAKHAPDPASE
ncbi:MAG TPA: hypothetical protein EYN60_05055 [Nitrospirales bacterium]|nr:hypothetical protein [Nitrospirales bacterium]HIN33174.1 hypothetical protein [Nitrospirales bacterium]